MKQLKSLPIELIFWITALILLATAQTHDHHFSLCPLANLGFDWCPGCGLGRSIIALFHGDLKTSFAYHWLGIPALLLIANRIIQLFKQMFNVNYYLKYKEKSHV